MFKRDADGIAKKGKTELMLIISEIDVTHIKIRRSPQYIFFFFELCAP